MKRSYGYPLGVEALLELCHPGKGCMSAPVRTVEDGVEVVYATNGWLTVRVLTHVPEWDRHPLEANALEWMGKMPWVKLTREREEFFQPLDGHTGSLWKEETLWPTHERIPGDRWRVRTLRPVGIGPEFVTSQALLQRVAKLPQVKVHIRTPQTEVLPLTFKGGTGLLRPLNRETAGRRVAMPRWRIYGGRKDLF